METYLRSKTAFLHTLHNSPLTVIEPADGLSQYATYSITTQTKNIQVCATFREKILSKFSKYKLQMKGQFLTPLYRLWTLFRLTIGHYVDYE